MQREWQENGNISKMLTATFSFQRENRSKTYLRHYFLYRLHFLPSSWHIHKLLQLLSEQAVLDMLLQPVEVAGGSCTDEPVTMNCCVTLKKNLYLTKVNAIELLSILKFLEYNNRIKFSFSRVIFLQDKDIFSTREGSNLLRRVASFLKSVLKAYLLLIFLNAVQTGIREKPKGT